MKKLMDTRDFLISKGIDAPQTGVVLGTGLHDLLKHVQIRVSLPYSDIPNFPASTVEFHSGNLIYGAIAERRVLIMQGRLHFYEGYTMQQITFPLRVMKMLGVQKVLLSNAAGGINLSFKKGDLVLLDDHINLQSGGPLAGKNFDELGPRFPDMSEPYDAGLKSL